MTLQEIYDIAIDYNNFFAEGIDAGFNEDKVDDFWHRKLQEENDPV